MSAKELRIERAKLIKDAQALANKPGATAEDHAEANRMLDESDVLMARVDTMERADRLAVTAAVDAALRTPAAAEGRAALPFDALRESQVFTAVVNRRMPVDRLPQADQDYFIESVARELRVIRGLGMRSGLDGLADADRAHYAARFGALDANAIRAAGGTVPDTSGGYTIAPLFEATMLIAMILQGGMRAASRTIQTSTGAPLPYPTLDDTAQKATILGGENVVLPAATDLPFGRRQIGAFTYVSGPMAVSLQLLQDSAFDFESLIRDAIAGRFVRGQNPHFTSGTGAGQPRGVVTAAPVGQTTAGGQVATVILDDLFELEASVNPVYRPGASWMMHDTTRKVVRKLKDTLGRPLWEPSLVRGAPDSLLTYPVLLNQDMAVPAASAKTIAFGDFSNYVIRDTLGLQIAVLRERYADLLQVAWIAYMRSDGDLLSAAAPIAVLQQAAS